MAVSRSIITGHASLLRSTDYAQGVMDLAWTPDGLGLFVCSYDGTIITCRFNEDDFGAPMHPSSASSSSKLLRSLCILAAYTLPGIYTARHIHCQASPYTLPGIPIYTARHPQRMSLPSLSFPSKPTPHRRAALNCRPHGDFRRGRGAPGEALGQQGRGG